MGTETSSEDIPKIRLVRRNLKGKIKLCPNCLGILEPYGELSGWLLPQEYLCEKCGYVGYVALEPLRKEKARIEPNIQEGKVD